MNPDLLEEAAELAGLQIPQEERDVLVRQMSRILAFLDQTGKYSQGISSQPPSVQARLRGDEPGTGAFSLAPPSGLDHGFLLVPRPFEQEDDR